MTSLSDVNHVFKLVREVIHIKRRGHSRRLKRSFTSLEEVRHVARRGDLRKMISYYCSAVVCSFVQRVLQGGGPYRCVYFSRTFRKDLGLVSKVNSNRHSINWCSCKYPRYRPGGKPFRLQTLQEKRITTT